MKGKALGKIGVLTEMVENEISKKVKVTIRLVSFVEGKESRLGGLSETTKSR